MATSSTGERVKPICHGHLLTLPSIATGIVALKNLLESDFDATGFDRNPYVSGIWHASTDEKLSSLPTTGRSCRRSLLDSR